MNIVARTGRLASGLLCAAMLTCGVQASAQMGDAGDEPAMNLGAGRMVRGTITAVAPAKLTLKTERGEVYTVALSANTQLRHGRDLLKVADVHVGDGAGAMGELDAQNKTVHALFVGVVSAEDLKKAREALGKTFISGTVTAIDETKLTIRRSDEVVQVIQVDEDTSFRRGGRGLQMVFGGDGAPGIRGGGSARAGQPPAQADGGESITLADIKIGDSVIGQGALKKGVFVPTTLGVSDPAVPHQRRRTDGGAAGTRPSPPGSLMERK